MQGANSNAQGNPSSNYLNQNDLMGGVADSQTARDNYKQIDSLFKGMGSMLSSYGIKSRSNYQLYSQTANQRASVIMRAANKDLEGTSLNTEDTLGDKGSTD